MLSNEEKKQYSRHLLLSEIGEEGQNRLKAAKVMVIGAGGLGCPVLQYLAAAGIGRIGIIDDDAVDQSNLQRQVLFTHNDIGKKKAVVAAQRLQQLNPYIQFDVFTEKLTKDNALELFRPYDIIVDGTDNFPTRYLVNDAAVLTNKPVVFGSIYKFEGQVSVFNYQEGPTYRCLYPTPPQANAVPNCSQIGVLGILPGIIGAFQANETLKMITGIGEVLSGKLLAYNALNMSQYVLNLARNPASQVTALEDNYAFFCGLPDFEEITFVKLTENKAHYTLLDVRTYEERDEHHIGGVHIPLDELTERFTEIPSDKDIVVYCRSGIRSARAIELLKDKGVADNLINLKGGLTG